MVTELAHSHSVLSPISHAEPWPSSSSSWPCLRCRTGCARGRRWMRRAGRKGLGSRNVIGGCGEQGAGRARHSARLAKRRRRTRRARTRASTKRLHRILLCACGTAVGARDAALARPLGIGQLHELQYDAKRRAAALQVHVHLNPDTKTQQQPKPISLMLAALLSFSHVLTFLLVLSFSNFFPRD